MARPGTLLGNLPKLIPEVNRWLQGVAEQIELSEDANAA